MKNYVAIGVLVVLCGLAEVRAQDGAAAASSQGAGKPRLENKLGLTDEQVKKMREIRDSGGSMAEMRAVLTPEQRAEAARMRSGSGAQGTRGARLQGYLGLSDEQMADITRILRDGGSREDVRAVLTPEQRSKYDAMHDTGD
ncbi:MAG: hypothetical protein KDI17_15095 [Halioglobus sp.]|nr:hypothetical protein [Halioglobus sp.]